MRRADQEWIQDVLVGAFGMDVIFPEAWVGWMAQGIRYMDYRLTIQRVRAGRMLGKSWAKTGDTLLEAARQAEQAGHERSAAKLYHRAALCYSKAFWATKSAEWNQRCVETYRQALRYLPYPVREVRVPFEGGQLEGWLHLPREASSQRRVPCVVFVPGMDMIKEDFPNPFDNVFVERGIACLSMDGPGQGRSFVNGVLVDADNYGRAGRAFIDWLVTQPEIDPGAIGAFGCSMGSFWVLQVAAQDSRVRACAGALCVDPNKERMFNMSPPSFKKNFMIMSGVRDDEAFDAMARRMYVEPSAVRCPALFAVGEFDLLCPLDDFRAYVRQLAGPVQLWVFENEFHPIGKMREEMFDMVADWFQDLFFRGRVPAGYEERWVAERR